MADRTGAENVESLDGTLMGGKSLAVKIRKESEASPDPVIPSTLPVQPPVTKRLKDQQIMKKRNVPEGVIWAIDIVYTNLGHLIPVSFS
jgi:hypothetical protein